MAQYGQTMDPSAGRVAMNSIFGDNAFRLGYLVKQNALWAAVGFNLNMERFSPSQLVKDTDQLLLVAYPSFNPKGAAHARLLGIGCQSRSALGGASLPAGRPANDCDPFWPFLLFK